MLAPRVIPCLDIDDGHVVKGIRFQGLRDAGDPVEKSASYEEQGADEIVLLDVSATPQGRAHNQEVVAAVRRELSIPLTVGGGIRAADDAARLLDSGADKVAVNTAAVRRPSLISDIAERFGGQCTVVSVDAARCSGSWEVVVNSGKVRMGIDVLAWSRRVTTLGAGEILLTSWDRDGTGYGYDIDLVSGVSAGVDVPVIASGGADSHVHMAEAIRAGASAVLVASILHDGLATVGGLKEGLAAAGIGVRR